MLDSYPQVRSGPPRPSRILTPMNVRAQSGEERYEIPGMGAWLLPIATGDRIIIRNAEGGQAAELVAADSKGMIDAGVIGARANSDARGLKALLDGDGPGMAGLRLGLTRRGIHLEKAGAVA
ncbi:MAG: aminomethyltransferase, partial [Gemmobacter sp.]|nr:aminomethyltransferase [Gemmobacter sp.]